MLKTCFECLTGTRIEHDTYETRLNGNTQTMWSTQENEEIFMLPRPLKLDDIISIRGTMTGNREKIFFSLKTGIPSQNNQDFALQMVIDFNKNIITLASNNSEPQVQENLQPSSILLTSEFKLYINAREHEGNELINISIGNNPLFPFQLESITTQDIRYFTLSNEVNKVEELTFTYA